MRCGDILIYRETWYYIGTKVRLKTREGDIVAATFLGDGCFEGKYKTYRGYSGVSSEVDQFIVEILEPVYPPQEEQGKRQPFFLRTGSGSYQHSDDVFYGFLLYLAVMVVGVIFKDRWLIWIAATIIYFGWKAKK